MNYPILYISTHQLSNAELKKYISYFQDHIINFTLIDNLRLISYHKYADDLHIRLEWFINNNHRDNFLFPYSLSGLFKLEEEGIIDYKRGNVIKYSSEDLAQAPDDSSFKIFNNIIRKTRNPIYIQDYNTLEFPEYKKTQSIDDKQLLDTINKYRLFQEYLSNRNVN